ncbi:hypothetical protein RirG_255760 [Rhizophagus irregularis DAOM 197198w]|uniref:Uncharacterized protein n=1 Tax=Rhizophagus irregularis (strain DAOM 197198w) TaxID=1432141 RepID=A0A015JB73_RHIIW|nr:hypothetical protein RirG_255760 [Rhizophagus irregularis DAOM 197198w]
MLLAPAQKLLLHSIAKWDITDCPRNLPYSSQVFLNLNKEVPRWIYGTGKSEESYSFNNLG